MSSAKRPAVLHAPLGKEPLWQQLRWAESVSPPPQQTPLLRSPDRSQPKSRSDEEPGERATLFTRQRCSLASALRRRRRQLCRLWTLACGLQAPDSKLRLAGERRAGERRASERWPPRAAHRPKQPRLNGGGTHSAGPECTGIGASQLDSARLNFCSVPTLCMAVECARLGSSKFRSAAPIETAPRCTALHCTDTLHNIALHFAPTRLRLDSSTLLYIAPVPSPSSSKSLCRHSSSALLPEWLNGCPASRPSTHPSYHQKIHPTNQPAKWAPDQVSLSINYRPRMKFQDRRVGPTGATAAPVRGRRCWRGRPAPAYLNGGGGGVGSVRQREAPPVKTYYGATSIPTIVVREDERGQHDGTHY